MPEVMIDGIKYVPATDVWKGKEINDKMLIRALVEVYWGVTAHRSEAWLKEEAVTLFVAVNEEQLDDDLNILAFVSQLTDLLNGLKEKKDGGT